MNLWLWPKLFPGVFDKDGNTLFVGIGTILNDLIPSEPFKVVFGAGVGYGNGLPILDKNWRIYCVRGPLSAQALRLPPEAAITDPAVLLRKVNLPHRQKLYPVSFMPHWSSNKWAWNILCQNMGLHLINPQTDVEKVLHDIQCSELVITEAMHGAIVADALRVPWIPVKINKGILEFKWLDWCQSVGLGYKPVHLPRLYSEEGILSRLHHLLRSTGFYNHLLAKNAPHVAEYFVRYMVRQTNAALAKQIAKTLNSIIRNSSPILSSDQVISSAISRFEEKLEQFKADYGLMVKE